MTKTEIDKRWRDGHLEQARERGRLRERLRRAKRREKRDGDDRWIGATQRPWGMPPSYRADADVVPGPLPTACLVWRWKKDRQGYGHLHVPGTSGKNTPAHRYFYEQHRGPIAPGMQPDHLCRNPSCINHTHLEVVTGRENSVRGFISRGKRLPLEKQRNPYVSPQACARLLVAARKELER